MKTEIFEGNTPYSIREWTTYNKNILSWSHEGNFIKIIAPFISKDNLASHGCIVIDINKLTIIGDFKFELSLDDHFMSAFFTYLGTYWINEQSILLSSSNYVEEYNLEAKSLYSLLSNSYFEGNRLTNAHISDVSLDGEFIQITDFDKRIRYCINLQTKKIITKALPSIADITGCFIIDKKYWLLISSKKENLSCLHQEMEKPLLSYNTFYLWNILTNSIFQINEHESFHFLSFKKRAKKLLFTQIDVKNNTNETLYSLDLNSVIEIHEYLNKLKLTQTSEKTGSSLKELILLHKIIEAKENNAKFVLSNEFGNVMGIFKDIPVSVRNSLKNCVTLKQLN